MLKIVHFRYCFLILIILQHVVAPQKHQTCGVDDTEPSCSQLVDTEEGVEQHEHGPEAGINIGASETNIYTTNADYHHDHDTVLDKDHLDAGMWYTDPTNRLVDEGPCNIDIWNSSLTRQLFLERYAYRAPVILRDVTDNSEFAALCSKASLIQNHGHRHIKLSSANTYSYAKETVTLQKYIEEILAPQTLLSLGNETMIWFGDNNYAEWNEGFFTQYNEPPYNIPGHTGAYSFGLAGPGTGVPFHFHGPGFAEVIYGRKRWFLYPPEQEPKFNPDRTTLHWMLEDYPELKQYDMPYECTMKPGEVIYFPDRWWHGTLNVDTSVFISTFLSP